MTTERTPDDTTAWPPEVMLLAGTAAGIPEMERSGQQQLVASTTLPTEMSGSEADFTALGFTLGAVVDGDPLFREATLPEGWRRDTGAAGDDPRGSYIVDERGIQRVAIFYKAAFYDRKASMALINVGGAVVREWIYGDDDAPELSPALTAAELADARRSAEAELEKAEKYPHRAAQIPRLHTLIAVLDKVTS